MTIVKYIYNQKFDKWFWVFIFCVLILSVGQSVPVYFDNSVLRILFYLSVYICLLKSSFELIRRFIRIPLNSKPLLALMISVTIGAFIAVFSTFIMFFVTVSSWDDTLVLFYKKDDRNIQIVSKSIELINFGPLEGCNYETVLKRPFLLFFKLETLIDTARIDKTVWVKIKNEKTGNLGY